MFFVVVKIDGPKVRSKKKKSNQVKNNAGQSERNIWRKKKQFFFFLSFWLNWSFKYILGGDWISSVLSETVPVGGGGVVSG